VVVLLEVEEDPRFVREGSHLIHELPVTFASAALGADVTVPTVDGTAKLVVPPGVQSGTLLRVRGKGLPELEGRGGRGDLLVRVLVWTPEHLTGEQEQLYRRLREVEDPAPDSVNAERKGFWSKVKEAFGGS
jgi:molecular chaperone DnaJ